MWTAQKKIPIANHSYYIDPYRFWCADQADQAPALEAVTRAFAYAASQGVVNTGAAGNATYDLTHKTTDDTSPNDSTPTTRNLTSACKDIPAELPRVVTVSALDSASQLAYFSNYGYKVIDVTAPGDEILSTYAGHFYAELSGTSTAAPYAAGVLALLKSTHPKATSHQLTSMLYDQADPLPCPTADARCTGTAPNNSFFGRGIVDALHAVDG